MKFINRLRYLFLKSQDETKQTTPALIDDSLKIPVHLAVIMDGNGRWAQNRGLPRSAGHRAGGENLRELCKNCGNYGVRYLTVYAFSTENWSRPENEIATLMELFAEFFERYDAELEKEGIRVRFTGDLKEIPEKIQKICDRAEQCSIHRNKMDLIVAFNYGGRREIVQACQKVAKKIKRGELEPEDITEELLCKSMYQPDIPDPDLIIRPSGEMRMSNFLTWESSYAELWVSDCLWPDFGWDELTEAFKAYTGRDRRYGGLTKSEV